MINLQTESEKETIELGKVIGELIQGQDAPISVCLVGEMASGKTKLSEGICSVLSGGKGFSSPTYTIMNKYDGDVYHMDAYRLTDISELDYIGFYDAYEKEHMIIEWADMLQGELIDNGLWISFSKDAEDFDKRDINIYATDEDAKKILAQLEEIYNED